MLYEAHIEKLNFHLLKYSTPVGGFNTYKLVVLIQSYEFIKKNANWRLDY